MTHAHDLSMLPLARRTLLALAGGRGKGLAVFSGHVWITEEGDPDDKILGAGESIVLHRPGRVVVEALEPSQVMLFDRMPWAATASTPAPAKTAGEATVAAPQIPNVEQVERRARVLRRQAIGDAVNGAITGTVQALSRWWRRATSGSSTPATRRSA